jgi:beta-lactam-binding protein with PASTA domain
MKLGSRFRRNPAPPPVSEGRTDTLVQEEVPGPPPVVEEEIAEPPPPPPPRGRPPLLWPWLLLLLLLVAAGLIALWLFTRGNDHKGARSVTVPNVIGQKQGPAVDRLNRAGLTSRVAVELSSEPAGTIFAEQPGPGTHVTRGSVVTLSSSSSAQVTVPDVVGDKAPAAIRALRAERLSAQTISVASSKPAGVVISQSPASGSSVAKGSTVAIRFSRGATRVPNVVGQTRSAAVSVLRAASLVPAPFVVPSSQPKNTVVSQRPHAGTSVPPQTKVRINISSGNASGGGVPPPPPPPQPPPPPASKSIPDVTGQPQEAAQRQLNAIGFKSRVVYVPSDQPQGTVVSQSPSGGTTAKEGTRITLNASRGPSPSAGQAVPKVIGLDPQTGTSRLVSAGFRVQRLTQKTSVRSLNGKVVDVQPAAGVHAPAGSTVTIYTGRFVS